MDFPITSLLYQRHKGTLSISYPKFFVTFFKILLTTLLLHANFKKILETILDRNVDTTSFLASFPGHSQISTAARYNLGVAWKQGYLFSTFLIIKLYIHDSNMFVIHTCIHTSTCSMFSLVSTNCCYHFSRRGDGSVKIEVESQMRKPIQTFTKLGK